MVDQHIMNIFSMFNFEKAEIKNDRDELINYDVNILYEYADSLINNLSFLGVYVPSRVEIVNEFIKNYKF